MYESLVVLLSLIIFMPAIGAVVLIFLPKDKPDVIRYFTLLVTLVVLAPVLWMAVPGTADSAQFTLAAEKMQNVFSYSWIPSFDIYYFMGLDGISFPLVVLTALISVFAMGASWSITKHVKGYCILFLLLETGMLGVFMALDFFLFYVFWEVMLLPMYFLIGVWGGPRKEYAAIKFFLYTLVGSVLMLIAILMLYFNSDLRGLAQAQVQNQSFKWTDLHLSEQINERIGLASTEVGEGRENAQLQFLRSGAAAEERLSVVFNSATETDAVFDASTNTVTVQLGEDATAADVVEAVNSNPLVASVVEAGLGESSDGSGIVRHEDSLIDTPENEGAISAYQPDSPIHTFNLLALAAIGQHTELFSNSLQWWCFILLFIGFAIKVPAVPVHTWLPDAHVEAPTPISMILAGVLLKMGGYGILRICYPICPHGGYDLAWFVCLIGVVSMVYGAFAAMAQKDFKRLVAYSSVSHMGYVVLGMGVWSAGAGNLFNPEYWNMGVKGAMFQMIGHGISSAGMFFMVGVIYDRVHHRNLNEFGGLFGKMPLYTALAIGIFFAGLGLPGLCGFIGEVLVVLSVWNFSPVLAIISASVVVLTAGYILWAIQRVYLGAEYKGPHEESLTRINPRELSIAAPLLALAILFGVFPHQTVLKYMDATIDRQVSELSQWTQVVKEQQIADDNLAEEGLAVESNATPPEITSNSSALLNKTSSLHNNSSHLSVVNQSPLARPAETETLLTNTNTSLDR